MLAISFLATSGCGFKTQEFQAVAKDGANGQDGQSMGLDIKNTASSCAAGGATITSFVDTNKNGALDTDEPVKQTAIICNGVAGLNGTNGTSVTVATATTTQCPTGGVVLNGITAICNGSTGSMGPRGEQGLTGAQGPRGEPGQIGATGAAGQPGQIGPVGPVGPAGSSGSVGNMTPVQLCPGDTASFKEYGFVVNNELFAVYFDKSQPIAFMAKLNPGNYVTTNGSNCNFTYSNTGTAVVLTNNTGTTTVPLAPPINGLACQVYDSRSIDRSSGLNTILTNATPKFSIVINQLDIGDSQASAGFPKFTPAQQVLVGTEDYALDCSGFIDVPKSQTYNLTMLSDDGSKLYINNNLIISQDQLQAPTAKSASLFMLKGQNKVNVLYFQGPLTQIALKLSWSAPEFATTVIPSSVLTH
jgi:hypothetical protein